MTKPLSIAAFLLGLAAVLWVGVGYIGTHSLGFMVTMLIATIYVLGALEMLRFRQATTSLAAALHAIPPDLAHLPEWIAHIHASLHNSVRLRIEGERSPLPGPALTPYLAALLVMLGMLGTFLGMVVTLNGAVMALESTTDLHTIRAALAAPIKGLGLSFGTSVAGVAASAVLGLISSLCRRERQQVSLLLDTQAAGPLRAFSHAHQRNETYKALEVQALAMPQLVGRVENLLGAMEDHARRLNDGMLAHHQDFLRDVKAMHGDLARSVEASLKESLAHSVREASASIEPLVSATLAGVARNTEDLHQRTAEVVQTQLGALTTQVETTVTRLHEDQATRDEARLAAMTQSMETMAGSLQREWREAGAQTLAQQQAICATLERTAADMANVAQRHAQDTLGEIAHLMQTASEAPRAAAEVIATLREEMTRSLARDNSLLEERSRIMATLDTLLDAINHAAGEHKNAIDALVANSAAMLDRVGGEFSGKVETETTRIAAAAAQTVGAAEQTTALGEAMGQVVQQFGQTNDKLIEQLQRIEASLERTTTRSDEQLAYTVAQAREVIDLCVMSQKQVLDELRQVAASGSR